MALNAWPQAVKPIIRIGRVAFEPSAVGVNAPNAFTVYLSSKIPGYSFRTIEYDSPEALTEAFQQGQLEFATLSPLIFPAIELRYGARAIATLRYGSAPNRESALFGSAIVCRKDAPDIHSLADLRGKRVAVFSEETMVWAAARREFIDLGIDPYHDFAQLTFGGTLPNPASAAVVESLRKGTVDAAILSGQFLLNLTEGDQPWYRVLPPPRPDPESQGFPFPLSTRLYPASPFVKAARTPIELATQVTLSLLNLPPNSEAARWTHSPGFTIPMNYESVHECLRELHLDPYTEYGRVTLVGFLGQHPDETIAMLGLIALGFALATWYVARLNFRLRGSLVSLDYQRQLIAQTSEAILATDRNGRMTFLNKAAEKLLGSRADQVLGKQADPGLPLAPGSSGEQAIQTAGGEFRRVEFSVSALHAPSGGAVACLHDVTDLRTLEEQYRQSQKLESIGRLAGGIAHDFNNLLTIINGYSFMLMSDACGPEQREGLEAILQAGERAAGLTSQLLAFSRKQILNPAILDLNAIVSGVEPMVRRVIGEDIKVVSSLSAALGGIRADAGQIEQVILNLSVNARDAMPEGGVLLFETADIFLDEHEAKHHSDLKPGPYVMLAVSDTGVGMDEATRSRLFEPFFTTKPVGKGTGLGLSTVYGIVRQSGGHIGVYSVPGRGSSFKIYFPRAEGVATKPLSVPVATIGGTEHILLAEDEEGVRALAARILTENGYRVWAAANGAEAWQIADADENKIDLLLTDVVMPDITGPRLAGQLQTIRPGLRVLYTSGYTDKAIVHNGELEEGVAFLRKPFTPALLLNAIRRVLDDQKPTSTTP